MTTKLDPEKVAQILDKSTSQIDGAILSSLQRARENAVKRQNALAYAPSLAGHSIFHHFFPHTTRQWIASGLLVLVLVSGVGIVLWQRMVEQQQYQQTVDTDVQLLTDELPIEVFVY